METISYDKNSVLGDDNVPKVFILSIFKTKIKKKITFFLLNFEHKYFEFQKYNHAKFWHKASLTYVEYVYKISRCFDFSHMKNWIIMLCFTVFLVSFLDSSHKKYSATKFLIYWTF